MWLCFCLAFAVVMVVWSTAKWKLHPFLALLFVAIGYGVLVRMPLGEIVKSINDGFGVALGKIGIVIVAGTIIGVFLEKSGGAYTMAECILRLTGRKNVPLSMSLIGYVIAIPVFCDSGFVILSPLNKALAKRSGISLAAGAIALSLGLYATHTMVPPTPGPVMAAGVLKADLGLIILLGCVVSFAAMLAGWLFAILYAARFPIDPDPELSESDIQCRVQSAPSAFRSFLPILIPILLIVLNSLSPYLPVLVGTGHLKNLIGFLGSPVIALLIGVLISLTLPQKLDAAMLSSSGWVGEALANAAVIILITGAGGSFGQILQNSGIADSVGKPLADLHIGIWLPFILAFAIKTAQGSSTVAIMTTASLVAPLTPAFGFTTPFDLAAVVVMIGAGSMCVSHANDSYFWVVTQFSRMDITTGYKLQSLGSGLEGLSAGVVLWIIHSFFRGA